MMWCLMFTITVSMRENRGGAIFHSLPPYYFLGPNIIILFAFCWRDRESSFKIQVLLHNALICCVVNTEKQGFMTDTAALRNTQILNVAQLHLLLWSYLPQPLGADY